MEFCRKAEIMDEAAMSRAIKRIAHEIIERNKGTENLMLIGIQRRGVPLAQRIGALIAQEEGTELPVGTLDITFYRDDLSLLDEHPQVKGTDVPANVNDQNVVLVDDVPVSYTHLDVYKRQPIPCLQRQRPRAQRSSISFQKLESTITVRTASRSGWKSA